METKGQTMNVRDMFGEGGTKGKRNKRVQDVSLKMPQKGEGATHIIGRIIPPMGKLRDDPRGWAQYVSFHFGHRGKGFEPGKSRIRTFACVEKGKWENKKRVILETCPKCEQFSEKSALLKGLQSKHKKWGEDSVLDTQIKELVAWTKDNSCKRGYKMYIMTPEGEIQRLLVSSKLKSALDELINTSASEGVTVVSVDESVYLDFKRVGEKVTDIVDTVSVAQEAVVMENGKKAKQDMVAPAFTDEQLQSIFDNCTDLTATETKLSVKQVQALVKCDQDVDTVDSIFANDEGVVDYWVDYSPWDGDHEEPDASDNSSAEDDLFNSLE